jgi:hypothetical protein
MQTGPTDANTKKTIISVAAIQIPVFLITILKKKFIRTDLSRQKTQFKVDSFQENCRLNKN